ncbi:MAG: serine/threonine-protein kinase [Polyangiaceae bacterium]
MAACAIKLGRYELLGEIAEGGMASVHLGRMTGTAGFERLVAVKVLHPHLAKDPDFVSMFLDEARLAGRIRHPHVVDVYDIEAIGEKLMIIMEYVEGAALSTLMRRLASADAPLPLGIGLRIVHETLLGLHAAHQLTDDQDRSVGLIHRDVSPANILVGVDGITRVTDFGVAKARGRITSTREATIKGKPAYLAPEQLGDEVLDARVDLFAVGIVLWECLTGSPLFGAESDVATFMRVLHHPIPPPSSLRPEVGFALDEVCLRALERDRLRRYASAAELADALELAAGKLFAPQRSVGQLVADLMTETLDRRHRTARVLVSAPRAAQPANVEPGPLLAGGRTEVMEGAPPDAPTRRIQRSRLPVAALVATLCLAGAAGTGWYAARAAAAAANGTSDTPDRGMAPGVAAAVSPPAPEMPASRLEPSAPTTDVPSTPAAPAAAAGAQGPNRLDGPRSPRRGAPQGHGTARPATSAEPYLPADL